MMQQIEIHFNHYSGMCVKLICIFSVVILFLCVCARKPVCIQHASF